jgi:transcriptional regulator with XRE-family HTH domain
MDDVATLLHDTRVRHGLSQARLARRAGTTQAVVSRIERGEASPSVATVRRLLGAMGWELHAGLRRSRWQDHDPEALRAFGERTSKQRVAGVERTLLDIGSLRGAARNPERSR